MRRRQFLQRLFLVPFLALGGWLRRARASTAADDVDYAALQAVVDTIVPADAEPGAVEAGVASQLRERLRENRWHRTIYRRGLDLLDRLAAERHDAAFATLALDERTELLESLLRGEQAAGLQFFLRARSDVFDLFYTSATGQGTLNYAPPVNGYPDYAQPVD